MDGVRREINGAPAMAFLVISGEKTEVKSSASGWFLKLYFIHATSMSTVVPDIYVV